VSAATLAIQHLTEAHDLLETFARRAEHEHAPTLIEAALRSVDRAEAVLRRLLDETVEWQQ